MIPSAHPYSRAADAVAGIEPSRVQFIVRIFQDMLPSSAEPRAAALRRIHDGLFLHGRSIARVRQELEGTERKLHVIAVTSGKGGVGKTTVALNLAIALAQRGLRVVLLDGDLGMANLHVYAGVPPRLTLLDVVEGRVRLADALTPGPAGVQLACGASGDARMAKLGDEMIDFLGRELRGLAGSFEVAVIDTGAGISAQVLNFLAQADETLVVATPNLAATLDAYGVIKAASEMSAATRMQVLVNQAADEQEARNTFARISGCAQRFLQVSPGDLGALGRDEAFERVSRTRTPLLLAQPENPNAIRFREIAETLACAARLTTSSPAHAAA